MVAQPTPSANLVRQSDFRILWLPTIFCLLLIAIEIHLLLNDRYFTAASKSSVLGESIATYVSGKNQVRKKAVGTLVWETPESQMPLYREDAIATMEDSQAILTFNDQSELIVEPNSLVILEQAPTGAGQSGKIIARLVKGSIKRRNGGTAPFLIKLSRAKDAVPIEIGDRDGHSVFRVIYKIEGYDVVVESGAVTVNGEPRVPGVQKLKAPRLNKPKIEIEDQPKSGSRNHGAWLWIMKWVMEESQAATPVTEPKKIRIHFSWEPITDAGAYRIQVSKDPAFTEILKEAEVKGTDFQFLTPAPEQKSEVYFRVAGIAQDETVGEYSSIEKVEMNPVVAAKASSVAPVAAAEAPVVPTVKPAIPPVEKSAAIPAQPAPVTTDAPADSSVFVVAPMPNPVSPYHGSFSYGALYDHRNFKSESNPREASGGGVVPAQLNVELRRSSDNEDFLSFGGSHTFEKAAADLPPPSDSQISTGATRVWLTYGRSFARPDAFWIYQFGPYLASSKKIQTQGAGFSAQNQWLVGAVLTLQNDPEQSLQSGRMAWKFQSALLAAGTFGVDLSASVRKSLIKNGDFRGLFCALELATRQSSLESSLGAAFQVGIWR